MLCKYCGKCDDCSLKEFCSEQHQRGFSGLVRVLQEKGVSKPLAEKIITHMAFDTIVEKTLRGIPSVRGPLPEEFCSVHKRYKFRCGCK